ncbi:MAG: alanine racemase [Brevinemataceae bacterium]
MPLGATRAEINISVLIDNIRRIRNFIGRNKKFCFVLKANAYGHGLVETAKYIESYIDYAAVASIDEGIRLRESGISIPILILAPFLKREVSLLFKYHLIPLLTHLDFLDEIERISIELKRSLDVHLKVNTGMNRIGFEAEEFDDVLEKIKDSSFINIKGICTHFSSSDELSLQSVAITKKQIMVFETIISKMRGIYGRELIVHAANSGGALNYNDSHYDMVRVGLAGYGYFNNSPIELLPVMDLKSKVVFSKKLKAGESISYGASWTAKRDTHIALLPIGYSDGISRKFSNGGNVKINSEYYSIAGRICMNLMLINTRDNFIPIETDVLIFGNDKELNAESLAKQIDTIPYEILTSVSPLIYREYKKTSS